MALTVALIVNMFAPKEHTVQMEVTTINSGGCDGQKRETPNRGKFKELLFKL